MNSFDEEELKLLNELAADISFGLEHIEQEDQLRYLACYDALTGLANSLLFHERLAQAIAQSDPGQDRLAVLVFDLDRFTDLNDTLGRHVGDSLLKHVADCMARALPESRNLARIGADTFAVAVSGLDSANESAALLCTQLLQTLSRPFMVHDHEIRLNAHAGIALYPSDGNEAATLFKNAEAALKQAQDTGNAYLYYRPEINAQVAAHLTLERELRTSLEAEHFVVYYQPKVDLRSGHIISAEALIRWQHPGRGLVPPNEFIPLAENSGLIIPMGEWILRAVCAQQVVWRQAHYPIVPIAVNVSAIQFQQGQVYDLVCQVLAETGLEANCLELELTESALVENEHKTIKTLNKLRDKGIHLALDDFGTGYSSLAYLKRFPFDILKIDRSFVTDITHNPDDAALAKVIIAIARQLNMRPLAEGVETHGQLNYLREQGCEQMQGYFFSRPVPAGEFAEMLRSGKCLDLPTASPADEKTLLLVDDEPAVLAALYRTLRPDGYRILRAESGKKALDLLAVNAVQVIVSDQRMPEMSGSEFLGIVRKLYPNTLRIILSGYTDLKTVTDSVNEGAVFKLLSKPWDDELLRQQIRGAFQLSARHPFGE